jgi:hypothetical protein
VEIRCEQDVTGVMATLNCAIRAWARESRDFLNEWQPGGTNGKFGHLSAPLVSNKAVTETGKTIKGLTRGC